jgi:hypothetical protein
MKKLLLGTVTALAIGAAVPAAFAAPIATGSNFSIAGLDNVSATQITFPSNGSLLVAAGSFAGLGTCTACVTLNTITYAPTVSSGLLLSIVNNLLTATFTLSPGATASISGGTPGTINIEGTGIATLTGYDPTPGQFSFTTQNGVLNNVTFSSTVVAVPEPASLGLFGVGMLGLGLLRRSRRKASAPQAA